MLSADCVRDAVENHGDSVLRLCVVMLKNQHDAEDVVQDTFLKYIQNAPVFNDFEHERAWLITVASNKCRDLLRFKSRHKAESEDVLLNYSVDKESTGVLETLMSISEKYRIILVLHYVEGYTINEISKITGISVSAVKMRLSRGRKLLEEKYRKEYM